jgi:hypothetical protein
LKSSSEGPTNITINIMAEETGAPGPTDRSLDHPVETGEFVASNKPAGHFEKSELFLEIETNASTAKTPWTGKLLPFQTCIWESSPSEVDSLPLDTVKELNEAYVDIRLANNLVWLSDLIGRIGKDTEESYLKLCLNISELFDKVIHEEKKLEVQVITRDEKISAKIETIYHQLKRAGVPLDHYGTTLRALVTKKSQEIIEQYKDKSGVDVFLNRNDHQTWYRILFGYSPSEDEVE